MDLWRISNHRSLSGNAGLKYAARWHTAGHPIVYLAESPAGALVEVLVHLELSESELPAAYTLLRVAVPDEFEIANLAVPPGNSWKAGLALTRQRGDAWLRENRTAVARVPSVILPATSNYLLNPLHPDAGAIKIISAVKARFDPRLLRNLGTG